MAHSLYFTAQAERDLEAIGDWIADAADREVALAYILRIRDRCRSLCDFPDRGTPRGQKGTARSVPFERRATILYEVEHDRVAIVGIFHAGRSIEGG